MLLGGVTVGGLGLCAMGLVAPRTFYRSTDRYCLRLRVVNGGVGLLYDGGPEVFDLRDFSFTAIGVVVESHGGRRWHHREVTIPAWVLVPICCIYPALLARGPMRRRRRSKLGQCLTCGYDLTGNESGVCPECGRKIEA